MVAEITNEALIASNRPTADAFSVFVPMRLILRSSNVASPLAPVFRDVVPLSVPVPEFREIVTVIPEAGTLFPKASFNCTVTGGAMALPAIALEGPCAKTR